MESHNHVTNNIGRTLDLVISNLPNVTVVRKLHPLVKEDAYHPSPCKVFHAFDHLNSETNEIY